MSRRSRMNSTHFKLRSWWEFALTAITFSLCIGLLDCAESQDLDGSLRYDGGGSPDQRAGTQDAAVDASSAGAAGSVALGSGGAGGDITRGFVGGTGGSAGASILGGASGQSGRSGGTGDGGSGVAAATGQGGLAGGSDGGRENPATFSQVYSMVLAVPSSSASSCAGAGCHIPGTGQSKVTFDTKSDAYKSLVSLAVVPGDSAGSTLYTNLATGVMPIGRPMLSDALIALVASWIDAGALND